MTRWVGLAAALSSLALVSLTLTSLALAAQPEASLAQLQADPDFVDLAGIPGVKIDLRYATTNNFTGSNIYGGFNHAFLHSIAADKLRRAAATLQQQHPGWQLLIYDAARPRSAQEQLWQRVVGTDKQRYVANPAKGSIHNYGFAVDLGVIDQDDHELDMGTGFDSFEPVSEPALEDRYTRSGQLSPAQLANRKILRSVMQQAGFIQLPLEWWHFDALPSADVHQHYPIIE